MTIDFNIFYVCKQSYDDNENEEIQEVNLINSLYKMFLSLPFVLIP